MGFREVKAAAIEIIGDLREIANRSVRDAVRQQDGSFAQDLRQLEDNIHSQRFTVGIVGVFNTGKSMLLNAMLKRDLLSCHILPETAAITSLSYNDEDRASIHYWTLDEWKQIENQAGTDSEGNREPELARMVREAKEAMGERFGEFITPEGRCDRDIPLDRLARYTSANAKNGLARLVREVDVATNLEFCKDNINIVDTPGLNDPIQLRELITLEKFLPRCDMLILVLPASQAFTAYDKRFIRTQYRKGRIHQLFVVVNQIDLRDSPEEIKTVVDWAKDQIERTFEGLEPEESGTTSRKSIEIFPISAKQSFLQRTGQGAKAIWTDEQSGVPAFENRLRRFLFEGERAEKMQTIIQARLKTIVEVQQRQLEELLANVDTPVEELEKAIEAAGNEAEIVEAELQRVNDEIRTSLDHFAKHFDACATVLSKEIPLTAAKIQDKALKKLNSFLESHSIVEVLMYIKDWTRDELGSFVNDTARDELEAVRTSFIKEIERLVEDTIQELSRTYQRMALRIEIRIPDVDLASVAAGLAADFAMRIAAGFVLRRLAIVGLAELSAAIAGVLAGPIGWAILAVATLWSVLTGGEKQKGEIREKIMSNLAEHIRGALDKVVEEVQPTLHETRSDLAAQLEEAAQGPAKDIERELNERMAGLEKLLHDKNEAAFDAEQRRSALLNEKNSFAAAMLRIESLAG
ncbi:MAG: dynamin family protein [Pseudomonadota bacterium]